MSDPLQRAIRIQGKTRTGSVMHMEMNESVAQPQDAVIYLTQESDGRDGMVSAASFYALPLWAIKEIHDYYDRHAPPFPGNAHE